MTLPYVLYYILCYSIGKYHSIHLSVIGLHQTVVGLLTRSVEDVEPHSDLVDQDSFVFEVYADGGLLVGGVMFLAVPYSEAGLADPRVPQGYDLVDEQGVLFRVTVLHPLP